MRKTKFVSGEYYHIYNRGVDKRDVFIDRKDYIRFIVNLRKFNSSINYRQRDYLRRKRKGNKGAEELGSRYREPSSSKDKLVDIIAYCLNPNHYHFIFKQPVDGGISKFMHKIDLGYTNYFNLKSKRSGALFQGKFKAIHINTDEYLLWLSAYINVNPEIHGIVKEPEYYPWCSYIDYIGLRSGTLCNKSNILQYFPNRKYQYKEFIKKCVPEMKQRKDLQKYLIE